MTTVRLRIFRAPSQGSAFGKIVWAALVCLPLDVAAPVRGQDRPVHWSHAGAMPPGAIGRQRLMQGGPLSGYCQPVLLRAPRGAQLAAAAGNGFAGAQGDPLVGRLLVGLQVGCVYRFRVAEIPETPGAEVYPTIELIDRLYPPPGLAQRFPIPVDLTWDELRMAAEGRFITRVIYVEDPSIALPVAKRPSDEQSWFDVGAGEDPLITAEGLGRPVAILRMGGRTPQIDQPDEGFLIGGAEPIVYDLLPEQLPRDPPGDASPRH